MFCLLCFHKPINESAGKVKGMKKEELSLLMTFILLIGSLAYVFWFGYPSLLVSIVMGAVLGLAMLVGVCHGNV